MDKLMRPFPTGIDLLDQADPYGRQTSHMFHGCAVWVVARAPSRMLKSGLPEYRHVCVLYDDEFETPVRERTGKRWVARVVHHRYYWTEGTTGWGNSRKSTRKLNTRSKYTEKRFDSREEAVAFAEKLKDLIARMVQKDED